MGASFPKRIAIAPHPPVGLAFPFGYTAISVVRTSAYLPSQLADYIQFIELNKAFVAP